MVSWSRGTANYALKIIVLIALSSFRLSMRALQSQEPVFPPQPASVVVEDVKLPLTGAPNTSEATEPTPGRNFSVDPDSKTRVELSLTGASATKNYNESSSGLNVSKSETHALLSPQSNASSSLMMGSSTSENIEETSPESRPTRLETHSISPQGNASSSSWMTDTSAKTKTGTNASLSLHGKVSSAWMTGASTAGTDKIKGQTPGLNATKSKTSVPLSSQGNASSSWMTPNESFSACLLLMDDNHRLSEWIAYHYWTMPLRSLIVAVDPRSKTSPAAILDQWRPYMNIVELWKDEDYRFNSRQTKGSITFQRTKTHRSRQPVFYSRCTKYLMKKKQTWTTYHDVDEYMTFNPRFVGDIPERVAKPGQLLQFLQELRTTSPSETHYQGNCIRIPRTTFGTLESSKQQINDDAPPFINGSRFETLRWRYHSRWWGGGENGQPKCIVDISKITKSFRTMPVHKVLEECGTKMIAGTFLGIHHYIGTWEYFSFRDDARGRDPSRWGKKSKIGSRRNDSIRGWVKAFVSAMGQEASRELLKPVGVMQQAVFSNETESLPEQKDDDNDDNDNDNDNDNDSNNNNTDRCAILFFGLPRAFESLVLPSVIKHIIQPNAAYHCDYFCHYYDLKEEASGRSGGGGSLEPKEVLLLKPAVEAVANATTPHALPHQQVPPPTVEFSVDKEEDFWQQYQPLLHKIHTKKDAKGRFLYYPWKAGTYNFPATVDNIVKMWHSIQSAWQLSQKHASETGITYNRMAVLRSDVVYMTDIDIYSDGSGQRDVNNSVAVVPGFSKHPVSDRIIYGPAAAVRIWATERFSRLDGHVQTVLERSPGWGMHSERFINSTVFPAIREEAGIDIQESVDMCFFRARVDDSVWISDCEGHWTHSKPSIMERLLPSSSMSRSKKTSSIKALVEKTIGRECGTARYLNKAVQSLNCSLQ